MIGVWRAQVAEWWWLRNHDRGTDDHDVILALRGPTTRPEYRLECACGETRRAVRQP